MRIRGMAEWIGLIAVGAGIVVGGCSEDDSSGSREASATSTGPPTPAEPVGPPTPLDDVFDEWRGLGGYVSAEEMPPRNVPPGQDSAVLHRVLVDSISSLSATDRDNLIDFDDIQSLRDVLSYFPDTLGQLHEATRRPETDWKIAYREGLFAELPYLAYGRNAARLLAAQARVRAADGDLAGAAESIEDGLRLARQLSQDAPFIALLVDTAITQLMLGSLDELFRDEPGFVPDLVATLDQRDFRDRLREALLMEGLMYLSTLWLSEADWDRLTTGEAHDYLTEFDELLRVRTAAISRPGRGERLPAAIESDIVGDMSWLIEWIEWLQAPVEEAATTVTPSQPVASGLLAESLGPALKRSETLIREAQMVIAVARSAVELRRQFVTDGEYPDPTEFETSNDPWLSDSIEYELLDDEFVLLAHDRVSDERIEWRWKR